MDNNFDFLKPVLGDDLFGQFTEKMAGAQGITLANISDGSYIPKAKFDTVNANAKNAATQIAALNQQLEAARAAGASTAELQGQIAQLKSDLAARDQMIALGKKQSRVMRELTGLGARDPEIVMKLIDLAKVEIGEDDTIKGLSEQIDPMKKAQGYLFTDQPGGRGGFFGNGGNNGGAGSETINSRVNDEIRRASGRF